MTLRWIIAGGVAMALLASFIIYPIKYGSQELRQEIRLLKRDIEQERNNIDILRAEWSYLTRPQRLQNLAQQHLSLQPIGVESSRFHVADLPWRRVRKPEDNIFFVEEEQ